MPSSRRVSAKPDTAPMTEADRRQYQGVAHHQAQRLSAGRAEGSADAQFAGALRHRVADHPVQARDREGEGHGREAAEQDHEEALPAHRARDHRFHGAHFGDRHLRIDRTEGLFDRPRLRLRRSAYPGHQRKARGTHSTSHEVPVHLRVRVLDGSEVPGVRHHSNDLGEGRVRRVEALSKGASVGEVASNQGLVHHDERREVIPLRFALREQPAFDERHAQGAEVAG